MLVLTTSLSIGNILFGFQSLFFYFSVIDAFWWFYTGSLKSALLLVVLLRGLLLVLLLSCYESLIFLMILLYNNAVYHKNAISCSLWGQAFLFVATAWVWLLKLNLSFKAVWIGGRIVLLILMLGKAHRVSFDHSNNLLCKNGWFFHYC